jgi:hypothetical protein
MEAVEKYEGLPDNQKVNDDVSSEASKRLYVLSY